jgi:hypothetical protein
MDWQLVFLGKTNWKNVAQTLRKQNRYLRRSFSIKLGMIGITDSPS